MIKAFHLITVVSRRYPYPTAHSQTGTRQDIFQEQGTFWPFCTPFKTEKATICAEFSAVDRGFFVRSRELESLALWLKEPTGQNTLILEVSSLRCFYAKHRGFSLCNFCTLCRILQVRVPLASLETVQKQCRNHALTLGQMKNDNFNHWLDGDLSDHKGKFDIQKEECPLVWEGSQGSGQFCVGD